MIPVDLMREKMLVIGTVHYNRRINKVYDLKAVGMNTRSLIKIGFECHFLHPLHSNRNRTEKTHMNYLNLILVDADEFAYKRH